MITTASAPATDLLSVRDLHIAFHAAEGEIKAVRGVSFRVPQRGAVALVGESGSGKSVVSQAIMGLLPRIGRIAQGEILFADPRTPGQIIDIAKINQDGPAMRALRGGRISIIFQEPMTSLNPVIRSATRSPRRSCCTRRRTAGARERRGTCSTGSGSRGARARCRAIPSSSRADCGSAP